jgi:hypothetical protein
MGFRDNAECRYNVAILHKMNSSTVAGSMGKVYMTNQPEVIVIGAGVMECGTAL